MTLGDSSLRETFFHECDLLLGKASSLFGSIADELSRADFKELHRCVHGIAGSAASMDMPQLASLARALEGRLDPLRELGAWPDTGYRKLCGDALSELGRAVAMLRRGNAPDPSRLAALEAELGAAVPASEASPCAPTDARLIAFSVSRSLAGAEIVVEHVLEELSSAGRIERMEEGDAATGTHGGAWQILFSGAVSDEWIRDLLSGIAEPGSLRVEAADAERVAAPEDAARLRRDELTLRAGKDVVTDRDGDGLGDAGGDAARDEGDWFVSFRVAAQRYVCGEEWVLDVRPYQGQFIVPGVPAFVRGLIGVGEEAVPLLDARRVLLGMDGCSELPDSGAMLVLQAPDGMVALLVDEAGRSLRVRRGQLHMPAALRGVFSACPVTGLLFGIDGVSLVLDVVRLWAVLDPTYRSRSGAGPDAAGALTATPQVVAEADGSFRKSSRSATIGPAGPPVPPAPRRGRTAPQGRRTLEEEWGRPDS